MIIEARSRKLRYDTVHPYQFVQPVVSREILGVSRSFSPEPMVHGHPSLKAVAMVDTRKNMGDDDDTLAIVDAAVPPTLSIPRELVEGAPSEAIGRFFGYLGDMWTDFLNPSGYRPLKEKNALALATVEALQKAAVAFGLPPNHPAYGALIAITEGLMADKDGRSRATLVIRSSAVSLVEQGQGRVFASSGKTLNKDDLRDIVLTALQTHCGDLLPKGGARSIDSLRGWESGKDTTPVERMALQLPDAMSEQTFAAKADQLLYHVATVYGPTFRNQ